LGDISSEGLAKGYNYTIGGVTAGIDYRLFNNYVIGLMGGYAHTWTDLKPGDVDVNSGWGGLYAGFYKHGAYILGAVYGGGSSFDTSRADVVGGRANGSSNTQQWSTFITVGYDFHCGQLTIGPLFAAQYSYVNMSGFTEHGSIADLSVREGSHESWRTDLGFRAWYTFRLGNIGVRPFVRAAWNHEYRESNLPISVSLVDIPGGPAVPVSGPSLGHDSAVVNAGVSAQITPTISTYVSYDGQLGRNNFDYNGVSGGFNISF
jgi:outer membrane autotransporter protein